MIPIKRIVLYKHGVGYFERAGKVSGNQSVSIELPNAQINDVLKSLTALDLSGGAITSIGYERGAEDASTRGQDTLRLDPFEVLQSLLSQLIGVNVELIIAGEKIDGVVMGIDQTEEYSDHKTFVQKRMVTLFQKGRSISSYDLSEISWINVLDDDLNGEIARLLNHLQREQRASRNQITLQTTGEGERDLVVSYLVEAPVWKTSYRLLIGEQGTRIQGWALIDNTSDEDWKDVRVSLVAGLPISFRHDLYSPRFAHRPEIAVPRGLAYGAPELEDRDGAFGDAGDDTYTIAAAGPVELGDAEMDESAMLRKAMPASPAPGQGSGRRERAQRGQWHASSAKVEASGEQKGALFEYDVSVPVSVANKSSALVPIVFEAIEAEKIALYSPAIRESNPLNALQLKNTTGLALEAGPVTVLDREEYAGEGMLKLMNTEDTCLLPYAVELRCKINREYETESRTPHIVRVERGFIHLHAARIEISRYLINNTSDEKLTLIIEHPRNDDITLVQTPEPIEKTENLLRFKLVVDAKATHEFRVSEQHLTSEHHQLQNLGSSKQVGEWFDNNYFGELVQKALYESIAIADRIHALKVEANDLKHQLKETAKDQERLRTNLESLGQSSSEKTLRDRYVKQLEESEDRYVNKQAKIESLARQIESLEKNRLEKLRELESERTFEV